MIDLDEGKAGSGRASCDIFMAARSSYDITESKSDGRPDPGPELLQLLQDRLARRVFPEIEKVHFMKCTRRTERYIIGCYDAEDGGHFKPHRDNQSRGQRASAVCRVDQPQRELRGRRRIFLNMAGSGFYMFSCTAVVRPR